MISAPGRLRQEDGGFEASQGYTHSDTLFQNAQTKQKPKPKQQKKGNREDFLEVMTKSEP
jgi:hypothetical protein